MAINFAKIVLVLIVFVLATFYIQQAKGQKRVILESISEMIKLTAIAFKGATDEEIITSDEYRVLRKGLLSRSKLYEIVTSAKPCNATTIKWLLTHSGLAKENDVGELVKSQW